MKILGSWIDPNAVFEGKPCFPHGMLGIFISGGAKCGKDAVIFQHVTIGSNMLLDSAKKGSPCIGNNAYLGAGCKLIGNIVVGDNVRVGANAVLTKNCKDNVTVVGMCEIRMIEHEKKLDNRFWRNKGSQKEYYIDGRFQKINSDNSEA